MSTFRYGLIAIAFACMTISPAVSGERGHKNEHGSHKHEHSSHKHDSHKHNKKHSGHKHEKGQVDQNHKKGHGAHKHGVSQLNVGVSGSKVEIELASPGVDIVGFEHKPSTAEQKKASRKRSQIYVNPAPWVIFLKRLVAKERQPKHTSNRNRRNTPSS